MKPVYCSSKTDTMAACVASILEVELSEIPDFFSIDTSYQNPLSELSEHLYDNGWLLIQTTAQPDTLGIAIMSFGEANHQYAVVWQDGCVHDPRPENSPHGRLISFFVLAPMDITDYVRTAHSQPPDHAYWSQVEPGTDFVVWDDPEDQVLYQKFRFYTEGKPWFSDRLGVDTVATFKHATPAVSVI